MAAVFQGGPELPVCMRVAGSCANVGRSHVTYVCFCVVLCCVHVHTHAKQVTPLHTLRAVGWQGESSPWCRCLHVSAQSRRSWCCRCVGVWFEQATDACACCCNRTSCYCSCCIHSSGQLRKLICRLGKSQHIRLLHVKPQTCCGCPCACSNNPKHARAFMNGVVCPLCRRCVLLVG